MREMSQSLPERPGDIPEPSRASRRHPRISWSVPETSGDVAEPSGASRRRPRASRSVHETSQILPDRPGNVPEPPGASQSLLERSRRRPRAFQSTDSTANRRRLKMKYVWHVDSVPNIFVPARAGSLASLLSTSILLGDVPYPVLVAHAFVHCWPLLAEPACE